MTKQKRGLMGKVTAVALSATMMAGTVVGPAYAATNGTVDREDGSAL